MNYNYIINVLLYESSVESVSNKLNNFEYNSVSLKSIDNLLNMLLKEKHNNIYPIGNNNTINTTNSKEVENYINNIINNLNIENENFKKEIIQKLNNFKNNLLNQCK